MSNLIDRIGDGLVNELGDESKGEIVNDKKMHDASNYKIDDEEECKTPKNNDNSISKGQRQDSNSLETITCSNTVQKGGELKMSAQGSGTKSGEVDPERAYFYQPNLNKQSTM